MKRTYFELYITTYKKSYIEGTLVCISENYCAVVTKTYWALKKLKKKEIVNMTFFVLFSFL